MSAGFSFEQLLQQCLLLPLFLDIALAAAVMRASRGPANRALAALLSVLCLVAAGALASDHPWGRVARAASGSLVGPAFLWLLWSYAGGRRGSGTGPWLPAAVFLPAAAFSLAAAAMAWPPSHIAYMVFASAYFACAAALFALLMRAGTLSGREPELVATPAVILFMSGPVYDFAYSGMVPLTLNPYMSAISAGILAYLVLRYKAFFFRPAAESSLAGDPGKPPAPGIYLARAGGFDSAMSVFASGARHGIAALAVTHAHPTAFRRRTGLRNIPVLWMANSEFEKSLAPSEIDVLAHAVKDYARQSPRSLVLLEDLDYIIANAGLYPTFEMLLALRPEARRSGSVIILSSELLTAGERRELSEIGIKPLR